jgi:hypothetical protein
LVLIGFVLFIPYTLFAQEAAQPVTTEEPATAPEVPIEPLPTAVEVAPIPAPTSPFNPDTLALLVNARADLDSLALQNLGANLPVGWSGSQDTTRPDFHLLLRLDLELLAGAILAPEQRPAGWFGAFPSSLYAIARDIRHDLELLADEVNPKNVRPVGWIGADPVMRCERGVQALINLLERNGGFTLTVSANDPNFCHLAELQAARFAEVSVLNPGAEVVGSNNGAGTVATGTRIDSEFAVAFLDRFGRQKTGTIPLGESITPVARSYTTFSHMMLVRGNGFEVFIDYEASTLSEGEFAVLQNVDNIAVSTTCTASWCRPGF